MTKTDELMFMADRYAGIGLGFGDPGPQRDALRTAIAQALAEATLVERERCAKVCEYEQYKLDRYCSAMGFGYTDPVDGKMCAAAIRKGETE